MHKKEVKLCDVCWEDGEEIIATASYIGDGGEIFYCCDKHLKTVKEAKLKFKKLK